MIDVNEQDYLRVLRIGNLTLQELYDTLEDAREKRLVATRAGPGAGSAAEEVHLFRLYRLYRPRRSG